MIALQFGFFLHFPSCHCLSYRNYRMSAMRAKPQCERSAASSQNDLKAAIPLGHSAGEAPRSRQHVSRMAVLFSSPQRRESASS